MVKLLACAALWAAACTTGAGARPGAGLLQAWTFSAVLSPWLAVDVGSVDAEFHAKMLRESAKTEEEEEEEEDEEEDDDDDDDAEDEKEKSPAATPPEDEEAAKREREIKRAAAHRARITASIAKVGSCFRSNSQPRAAPRAHSSPTLRPHREIDPLVLFRHAIDETDLDHIMDLVSCVRRHQPDHVEDRPFNLGKSGYGGGNNVTYIGGFFEAILGDLTDHLLDVASDAAAHAGWVPHPRQLGIRCIELLEYNTGGELLMHVDADSVYTLVLMLVDRSEFTGGKFVIQHRPWSSAQNATSIAALPSATAFPERLGGMLFDSNCDHAVAPIKTGKRTVLAIELWPYDDVDIDGMRPHAKYYAERVKKPTLQSLKVGKAARLQRHRSAGVSGGDWGWAAAVRAVVAIFDASGGGSGDFARGVVSGLAAAFLVVFLFFRDASPLPANMMPAPIPPSTRAKEE